MRPQPEHPLREELHNELHARPSLYFDGDSDVWHVAIVGEDGIPSFPANAGDLEEITSTQEGKHGIARLHGGRLKWEIHTEFLTLTFVTKADTALDAPVPSPFLTLCDGIGGRIIACVRVVVREEKDGRNIERPPSDYVASTVGGGDAEVHSNFRIGAAGAVEFFLFNRNLNAYRTGRMVRRLLEIETYRMMALLAMPVAHQTVEKLSTFDHRLNRLVTHMQSASKVDKALLSDMTKLSSDVLNVSADARKRFGATKAYAEIVGSRLQELRETHVEQRQRIGTFIDRRFRPAIRSFQATERRLDELAERVSLAGDLLRTTVQVQLEDQNASLLTSMDERTRVQVHIQQAVEGFSIIAITYYTIGLIKVCLESLVGLGFDAHLTKLMTLVAVPLVFCAVWSAVRHVRKSIAIGSQPKSSHP